MPTIEERLQALEQENAARKKTEEMLTIAVRALVSKEAFEKLQEAIEASQEQNGKLFNVLINQGSLHNERMADLQGQIIDLDGKTVGLQTEARHGFANIRTEIHQIFTEQTALLQQILTRLPE